jgi:hypothetical protein
MKRFSVSTVTAVIAAVVALTLAGGSPSTALAQGITTGAVQGRVTDPQGQPLANATIEVTDKASGYVARGTSRESGAYFVQGLDIGSAYTVTVRHIGFAPQTRDNIAIQLSKATRIDWSLSQQDVQLAAIKVQTTAEVGDFSSTRKGIETDVSDSLLHRLPNENRSLYDFMRQSPEVVAQAGGVRYSAGGENNRYNSIQVDGVDMTDRFGLATSQEPGGQSGGRAMTLEAVKEYQVLLSPFDVRQGTFTGAAVNAVTKSGTNEFHGGAFYYLRNQDLAQNAPFIRNSAYSQDMYGLSLGGPIVKDKIHFFFAFEGQTAQQGATGPYFGQPSSVTPTLQITQAQIDSVTTKLASYNIPAGTAGFVTNKNPLTNVFARLDFNLGENSRLVVREVLNTSHLDVFSRTSSSFWLGSDLETKIDNNQNTTIQLFTNFKNGSENELTLGYSYLDFQRQPSVISPQVQVQNIGGTGGPTFIAGTDNSSSGNFLKQRIIELTDNYTLPVGTDHTVTVGTHEEFYGATNGFLQNSYGNYTWSSLSAFVSGAQASSYSGSGSLGGDPVARWNALQTGIYAQDVWQATPHLNVTYGIRMDAPFFTSKPGFSQLVDSLTGYNTTHMPTGNWQYSPRVGFNWDMTGDQKNQLRGGTGLFQGDPAFVWMSNMYSNSGVALGQLTCGSANTNGSAPTFNPAPVAPTSCAPLAGFTGANAGLNNQPGVTLNPIKFAGTINVVDPNLKFPQVWRTNLGYDHKLPWDLVATVEGSYTYGLNDFITTDLNLVQQATTDPHGRVLFGTFNSSGQSTPARMWSGLGDVILIQNYGGNYSYSFTGQLKKTFTSSWEGQVAYTYSRSYSVSDMTSSVAYSNFEFGRVLSGPQSQRQEGPSAFDQPYRLLISGTWTLPWKSTDISFIATAQSGTKYSYTVGGSSGRGDLNGDGVTGNDNMFIPNNFNDPTQVQFQTATFGGVSYTPAQQLAAFQQFVNNNKCLSSQEGTIMARNSCSNPWYNTFDVALRQRLPSIGSHTLMLNLDIYNFMNLVNSKWGKIYTFTANTDASVLTVGTRDGQGNPVYTFNPLNASNSNIFTPLNAAYQYYQIQLSVRYAF